MKHHILLFLIALLVVAGLCSGSEAALQIQMASNNSQPGAALHSSKTLVRMRDPQGTAPLADMACAGPAERFTGDRLHPMDGKWASFEAGSTQLAGYSWSGGRMRHVGYLSRGGCFWPGGYSWSGRIAKMAG